MAVAANSQWNSLARSARQAIRNILHRRFGPVRLVIQRLMVFEQTQAQSTDEQQRAQQLSLHRSQPPAQVPGYDARKFLGAGAYGEVWVAVDRNTGRKVAIKFYAHQGGLDWNILSREVEKLAFLSA